MEHEIDRWIGTWSAVNAGVVLDCCGEKGAEPEGKAFDLPVNQCSKPHPWLLASSSDGKNEIEIVDASGQK